MPANQFLDISLTGSVTVVPPNVRSIEEDVDLFGGNIRQIERLKKTLGLNERRIASSNITSLDLCEQAAQVLLDQLNIKSSDVDGILFVTQTPDHSQPSNASLLHGRLGCDTDCAALDLGLGCSGLCLCTLVGLFNYCKWFIAKSFAFGGRYTQSFSPS
jgi:3-oxoacyl-[acyl-carrier-protein] synthase-3